MLRIGYYSAALGSIQQEKSLSVISNNLANISTPGFKKDAVHFRDYIYQTTYTQMGQGRIRPTGSPLDVALSGDGMLRVQSDNGIVYTRGGNLTFNKDRTLVTQEGWPVLGQNGSIQVSGTVGEDIRIERNGQVFDGEDLIDTLFVAQFPPETRLEKIKNGYFRPVEGQEPVASEKCEVQQGSLEEANFNMVEEMARMIETTRAFEAYQKAMQVFEQQDSQLTSKLGNG
jgi:flagellar basal-body rod protein FlgG